jgi:rhodanese-related sulfurtransferase
MDSPASISPRDLFDQLGSTLPPLVFDVRRTAPFDADSRMLVSAQRGTPDKVAEWGQHIPAGQPVVVYCVYGHEVSQGVAAALREAGCDARYLEGGINGWAELGLPLRNKAEPPASPGGRA